MDVNVERAEDVLTHKRLLHLACDPSKRPAFEVRLVQVNYYCSSLVCDPDMFYILLCFNYLVIHVASAELIILTANMTRMLDDLCKFQ